MQEVDINQDSQRRAYLTQLYGLMPRGVRSYPPMPPFYTGYFGPVLYDWDQYFEGILLCNLGWPTEYLKNGVRIFLGRQQEDGFIPRCMNLAYPGALHKKHNTMAKPFLGQLLLLCHHQTGSSNWIIEEGLWDKLLGYINCWRNRFKDADTGLSIWHSTGQAMDNLYERCGRFEGPNMFCAGVDINAYLVRELTALSILAKLLGFAAESERLETESAQLSESIRQCLWHEEDGIFYDWNVKEKKPIKLKCISTFTTLWAKTATQEQASRVIEEHLVNPEEFWRPWPIPALAASEPTYVEGFLEDESTGCCSWRGNTWMPMNYMIFQGLRYYGHEAVARELADKTFALFQRSSFSEYYTSESGVGCGQRPFWGWSALALFMDAELKHGYDATALSETNDACNEIHQLRLKGAM